ncbi:hypothetical protein [Streptomyces sp. NBC_01538]|uniref:hypothetical protein n=1 Tax=Streptomyces sp. NBC_01538 TaxID=2903897 RepID=UPI003864F393
MTNPSPDPGREPFHEVSETDFADRFIALGIEQAALPGGGVILYGRCPRCLGRITVPLPDATVKSVANTHTSLPVPQPDPADTAENEVEHPIACTCTGCEHPGRPAQYADGCGAYWSLILAPVAT